MIKVHADSLTYPRLQRLVLALPRSFILAWSTPDTSGILSCFRTPNGCVHVCGSQYDVQHLDG